MRGLVSITRPIEGEDEADAGAKEVDDGLARSQGRGDAPVSVSFSRLPIEVDPSMTRAELLEHFLQLMGGTLARQYSSNRKVLRFVEKENVAVELRDDDQLHDTLIEFTRRHPVLLGYELDGHLRTDLLLKLLSEAEDEATQVSWRPMLTVGLRCTLWATHVLLHCFVFFSSNWKLTCTFQLWKLADRKDYDTYFAPSHVAQLHDLFLHACDVFQEDADHLPAKLSHCLLAVLVSLYCSDKLGDVDKESESESARWRRSSGSTTKQGIDSARRPRPVQESGVLCKALHDYGFPHSVLNIPDHCGKVCESAVALGLNAILTLMSEGGAIETFANE